jgi:phosphonate transport system ATP-binding protein
LTLNNIDKKYENQVHALKNLSLEVKKGEFLVIIGLSGSGKSTLLRCINRLVEPTSGTIVFQGKDITRIKGEELRRTRSQIGMVFQHFNLIPRSSVLKNTLLGSLHRTSILNSLIGKFSSKDVELARHYLEIVGLESRKNQRADSLSGGQQQRVAMARALMQNPILLLADEPVASLDPATSHSVMKYLKKINEDLGITIICNLHFLSLVREYASRVLALKEGEIVYKGLPGEIDEKWFKKIYGEDATEVEIK